MLERSASVVIASPYYMAIFVSCWAKRERSRNIPLNYWLLLVTLGDSSAGSEWHGKNRGILSRFKKRFQNDKAKTILSLLWVKGGGFALAKTEGLFWVYICVKKIYLIAKTIIYLQSPTRFTGAPFTQRGLIMHFAFSILHLY